jgi:polyvinyl alcohol dehydrogenase (cytochrome)
VIAIAPSLPAGADPGLTSTYLHDDARDGYFASETAINATTAPNLVEQWTAREEFPGGTTEPIDSGGVLYWSDSAGTLHATNETTHADNWTYPLGTTFSSCFGGNAGPDSTPTVASVNGVSTVFLGGGTGQFLAINAATGALLWQDQLTTSSAGFVWSSPLLYNGSIYIGVASVADCPLVPGELFRLDAGTGTTQATFTTVPDGCLGATIWSSPTINDATGELFVDTGNGDGVCPSEPFQEAMIRLNPTTLAVQDSWQTQPNLSADDYDFGATPTLFTATINGQSVPMVGAMNKNGYYYAFRQDNLAAGPVWTTYFATPGDACVECDGTFLAPSAWDGSHLFVGGGRGVINSNQTCDGSLSELDPSTGAPIWQDCLPEAVYGAVTAVPGVVEVNAGDQAMLMDASDGRNLFTYTESVSGNVFWGPAEFANGAMYVINQDGWIFAFVPGPPVNTPEAPLAIFLPIAGAGGAIGVVAYRRRRSTALLLAVAVQPSSA